MEPRILALHRDDRAAIARAAHITRHAYAQEAKQLSLTKDSCPTHAAFASVDQLEATLTSPKMHAYGMYLGEEGMIGFLLLRELPEETMEVLRLCVAPKYRGKDFGALLQAHAQACARALGASKLTCNVAADNEEQRMWYEGQGYTQRGTLRFPHVPYKIGFLEKLL